MRWIVKKKRDRRDRLAYEFPLWNRFLELWKEGKITTAIIQVAKEFKISRRTCENRIKRRYNQFGCTASFKEFVELGKKIFDGEDKWKKLLKRKEFQYLLIALKNDENPESIKRKLLKTEREIEIIQRQQEISLQEWRDYRDYGDE